MKKNDERKRLQTSINVMAAICSQKKRKIILCYYERRQNKDGNGRAKLQHKRTLARTNTPLSHEILRTASH